MFCHVACWNNRLVVKWWLTWWAPTSEGAQHHLFALELFKNVAECTGGLLLSQDLWDGARLSIWVWHPGLAPCTCQGGWDVFGGGWGWYQWPDRNSSLLVCRNVGVLHGDDWYLNRNHCSGGFSLVEKTLRPAGWWLCNGHFNAMLLKQEETHAHENLVGLSTACGWAQLTGLNQTTSSSSSFSSSSSLLLQHHWGAALTPCPGGPWGADLGGPWVLPQGGWDMGAPGNCLRWCGGLRGGSGGYRRLLWCVRCLERGRRCWHGLWNLTSSAPKGQFLQHFLALTPRRCSTMLHCCQQEHPVLLSLQWWPWIWSKTGKTGSVHLGNLKMRGLMYLRL